MNSESEKAKAGRGPTREHWRDFLQALLGEDEGQRLSSLLGVPVLGTTCWIWNSSESAEFGGHYGAVVPEQAEETDWHTCLVVTIDHPAFVVEVDKGWVPVESDEVVVEVAVVLALRLGKHFETAHRSVQAAMDWAGGTVPVTALHGMISGHVALLDAAGCRALEDKPEVWLYLRSGRLPRHLADRAPMDLLRRAAEQLSPRMGDLLSAGFRARGAIDGLVRTRALSDDALTGWCGELVARRHHATTGLAWISGDAVLDFQGQGKAVEVKSTHAVGNGRAHLSEGQVAAAARLRDRLTFLTVKVDPAVVARLRRVLQERGTDGEPPAKRRHELERLAMAIGWPVHEVYGRWERICQAIGPLGDAEASVWRGPFELGAEVLAKLASERAGLSLPLP